MDVAALVHDEEEASHAGDLDGLAERVTIARVPRLRNFGRVATSILGSTPLTHVLLDSPALVPALEMLVADIVLT